MHKNTQPGWLSWQSVCLVIRRSRVRVPVPSRPFFLFFFFFGLTSLFSDKLLITYWQWRLIDKQKVVAFDTVSLTAQSLSAWRFLDWFIHVRCVVLCVARLATPTLLCQVVSSWVTVIIYAHVKPILASLCTYTGARFPKIIGAHISTTFNTASGTDEEKEALQDAVYNLAATNTPCIVDGTCPAAVQVLIGRSFGRKGGERGGIWIQNILQKLYTTSWAF